MPEMPVKPFPIPSIKPGARLLLDPDTIYRLDKPFVFPCSDVKIDVNGGDPKHPYVIQCKNAGAGDYDTLIIRKGTKGVRIANAVIDAKPKLRGINNGGTDNHFENIAITQNTMMAIIFMSAKDSTINMTPGFSQREVTLKGYTYFTGSSNCWLKRVVTYGDFFENEHRFHANVNCGIEDLTVYGANPENDVNHDENPVSGVKDNALRVHDGSYTIKKVVGTGNMRLGCMGDDDGGKNDWLNAQDLHNSKSQRERYMAEYLRKMSVTSQIKIGSMEWYGNVRLESNLTLDVDLATIYVAGGDSIIRVDPDYVVGSRRRKAALANFKKLEAFNVSIPGAVKKAMEKPTDFIDLCRQARAKSKFNPCSVRSGTAGKIVIQNGTLNQK